MFESYFLFQISQLEKDLQERLVKDAQKEQHEAEVPIINPGMGGIRLITNGYVNPTKAKKSLY